ncbi:MAG: DNA-protecting protein DprA, partial [Aquificota bacterium]
AKEFLFDPEKVVKLVEENSIGWLTLEDPQYPLLLKDIEDPPPVLFYRGGLKSVPLVGVVGARKPDLYSIGFTKKLVYGLVEKGYGIVSGGAKGIDYTAHLSCLQAGGYTVVVLGMGILRLPPYLEKLQGDNTLFLSELLPEANPEEYTFPRRNRLISGLSSCLVVVEAGEKSGALITAEYAVKQKRPLFVHVGVGSNERWFGCVNLINQGKAKFLRGPQDITGVPQAQKQEDGLLNLLSAPKSIDELMELTGLPYAELVERLSLYEIEGKVVRMGIYYKAL